jgi:hypothetical protein
MRSQICWIWRSDTSYHESIISWDETSCMPIEVHRHFWGNYCPHVQNGSGSKQKEMVGKQGCLATTSYCSSVRKMEEIRAPGDSVIFYRTLWRYKQKAVLFRNYSTRMGTSVALVRERTIPIERPPLVGGLRIEGCRVVGSADPLRL